MLLNLVSPGQGRARKRFRSDNYEKLSKIIVVLLFVKISGLFILTRLIFVLVPRCT